MSSKTVKKHIYVALKVMQWVVILFLVGCLLTILAQKICGQTPNLFGYSTYRVVTDSMTGTYNVGDVVICKADKDPTPQEYKVGDVIAFIAPYGFDKDNRLEGYTVTHRIVEDPYYDEKTDTWYVKTRGDKLGSPDDRIPIPVDNIQGKIVGTSSFISTLARFLSKWYGFVTVIVIPLLAIMIWQIVIFVKENTKAREEKLKKEQEEELKQLLEQQNKQKELEEQIKKKAIEEYINSQK